MHHESPARLLKVIVIEHLKDRYKRQYSDVISNEDGNPDIILSNHGLKVAGIFVEEEASLTTERAEVWRRSLKDDIRIIVLVPSKAKTRLTSLLWDMNLMTDISVGTYDLHINTPV
ncbi:MAG: hypothetical protein SNJ53_03305 [Thermodesulfovibrionales bacterium]